MGHPKSSEAPASDRPKTLGKLPLLRGEPPELVPARMINEVLYCERLMVLEWAQGEFADNVYTVDGRVIHRRSDQERGSLPDADDEDDAPFTATSVWLSSEKLGIDPGYSSRKEGLWRRASHDPMTSAFSDGTPKLAYEQCALNRQTKRAYSSLRV